MEEEQETQKQQQQQHFGLGEEVEVQNEAEGFEGSWYAATVILQTTSLKRKQNQLMVRYHSLLANARTKEPLVESVDLSRVRPRPPAEEEQGVIHLFELGDEVDAYYNDGWWEGTITQSLENLAYRVYFKHTDEEMDFQQSDLRIHHEWVSGRWVVCPKEVQQTTESPFGTGSLVEVRFVGKNCDDAWFPAKVLKQLNDNLFLVEYRSSRLQYMVGKLKETVGSSNIRPLPPQTSLGRNFNLFDKVDAFYDCAWWSGVITKVLSEDSLDKYIVHFEHQSEQKEFDQSELRVHRHWVDGNWITDTEAFPTDSDPEEPLENGKLPFVKSSPMWKAIESEEVFQVIPQQLHFRPLEQYNVMEREGMAIGSMVNYVTLLERVRKTQFDDPTSVHEDISMTLGNLKALGFNIQPVRERLEVLSSIKIKKAQFDNDLIAVEKQINTNLHEKERLQDERAEIFKKIRELQESINQLNKKSEQVDSCLGEAKITIDTVEERIHGAVREFNSVASAPWATVNFQEASSPPKSTKGERSNTRTRRANMRKDEETGLIMQVIDDSGSNLIGDGPGSYSDQ